MTLKPISIGLTCLTLAGLLSTGPAQAHLGHVGELAIHNHWGGVAAIGLAVAVGVWGALKGKKQDEEVSDEAEENSEEETA